MTVIKILNSPKATIIPCIHEESGCSGLFNTITNEFYPVKTTEFEYIQSAETQYIDTGVQPKGGRMNNKPFYKYRKWKLGNSFGWHKIPYCPHCKRQLGTLIGKNKEQKCPMCGGELDWEDA